MIVFKFRTNISTEAAEEAVASILNQDGSIRSWKVDRSTPENILRVAGEQLEPQYVSSAVRLAGYQAELVQVFGAGGEGV